MKNKVLTFIIGILVGAIITTIGFVIYNKSNTNKEGTMPNGNLPQMMEQGTNQGTPPEKPEGEEGEMQGTPPEMPSNQKNDSNNNSDNTSSKNNS